MPTVTLAVVEIGLRFGATVCRTPRAVQDEAMISASVHVLGAVRGGAPAGDVGDVMFWNAGVVTAGEGRGPALCLDERAGAATAWRRGSRPVGAKRFWPSIPVDRWPRTAVCAEVVGGNRTRRAESAIGWGER